MQKTAILLIFLLAISVYFITLLIKRKDSFIDMVTLQPEIPIVPFPPLPVAPPSRYYVGLKGIVPITGEFPKAHVASLPKNQRPSIDFNWQFFSTDV